MTQWLTKTLAISTQYTEKITRIERKTKSFKHIYFLIRLFHLIHTRCVLCLDKKNVFGFFFLAVVFDCYFCCCCCCYSSKTVLLLLLQSMPLCLFFFLLLLVNAYLFSTLLTQKFDDLFRSYLVATVFLRFVISQSNFTNDF